MVALGLFLFRYFIVSENGGQIRITQDGKEIGVYSLFDKDSVLITDSQGGTNFLIIKDGQAFISEADCPDKLCIRQKAVSKKGESIICLPHKLVIEVTAGLEKETDAVVR